jgi:hypothetical protein
MSSRRRRRSSSRLACFAPVLPAAAAGWQRAGEPLHAAGLLLVLAVLLLAIGWVRMYVPSRQCALGLLAPRGLRIAHRHVHGRENCSSARISKRLRRLALAAGRGRCVYGTGCRGATQLDHYRPWSLGGFTTLFNLMCLCAYHNRVKSNFWAARGGYVFYTPMPGANNPELAALVLAAERRARRSLRYWLPVMLVALVSA